MQNMGQSSLGIQLGWAPHRVCLIGSSWQLVADPVIIPILLMRPRRFFPKNTLLVSVELGVELGEPGFSWKDYNKILMNWFEPQELCQRMGIPQPSPQTFPQSLLAVFSLGTSLKGPLRCEGMCRWGVGRQVHSAEGNVLGAWSGRIAVGSDNKS